MSRTRVRTIVLFGLVAAMPACATAQKFKSGLGGLRPGAPEAVQASRGGYKDSTVSTIIRRPGANRPLLRTRRDSLEYTAARGAAMRSSGYRVVVSLADRALWVLDGDDTLRVADVAVGMGQSLEYGSRSWFFATPRGQRKVLRKESDPVWIPPEWAYAEVAREYHLKMRAMLLGRPVVLKDGSRLLVKDSVVGVVDKGKKLSDFEPLPVDEHIVFDGVLYIPPTNSKNRRIEGELGKYRLDLGEGYLLHGTPHQDSIGQATTHGCVRLRDDDIEWLYNNVPVGAKVYIF
jgi:hypothetical protein